MNRNTTDALKDQIVLLCTRVWANFQLEQTEMYDAYLGGIHTNTNAHSGKNKRLNETIVKEDKNVCVLQLEVSSRIIDSTSSPFTRKRTRQSLYLNVQEKRSLEIK